MIRTILTLAAAVIAASVLSQVAIPSIEQIRAFSDEGKDWGVALTSRPQGPSFGKPTPTSIPGAQVIKSVELKTLLDTNKPVVIIDVLDSTMRTTVPGAYWMPRAGDSWF